MTSNDVAHWHVFLLTEASRSVRRHRHNLQTYVMPGGGNKVALSMEVADMDALDAMLARRARRQ